MCPTKIKFAMFFLLLQVLFVLSLMLYLVSKFVPPTLQACDIGRYASISAPVGTCIYNFHLHTKSHQKVCPDLSTFLIFGFRFSV